MLLKNVRVAGKTFKLCGRSNDMYFENVEDHLEHGNFFIPILAHHVRRGATLIDVGANLGGMTALMNLFVQDARIISIEPSGIFDCLLKTVAENNFVNTECLWSCVGERDGFVAFADHGANDESGNGSSASFSHMILQDAEGDNAVPIRMLDTIASELNLDAVDLVKIDVEGFESSVLDGMKAINQQYQPLIFMEFNSFTIAAHARQNPILLLERIRNEFGSFFGIRDGGLKRFRTDADISGFFLENMTKNGCVEDIVFSASPDKAAAFQIP